MCQEEKRDVENEEMTKSVILSVKEKKQKRMISSSPFLSIIFLQICIFLCF